jgi:uncharacterized protein YggT (Ycf19 family)
MGFIIVLVLWAVGAAIFWAIIRSAVRDGVEEALRNHHEWLNRDDQG